MVDGRKERAKLNIIVSLGCQMITLICGFITPQLMIKRFGSEAYGATTSIAQFLSYIALLEGGIGGVARAALYRPLAQKDTDAINAVMYEIRRFFRIVAYVFILYAFVIACSFKKIAQVDFLDWTSTFVLVIIISLSTFGQYFIGISNSILLQAAQKSYITNFVSIITTVINTIVLVALVNLGSNLITVKFASSLIFVTRPVVLWFYVNKYYKIKVQKDSKKIYLTQKWIGLGQHIAFFLHTNTDIVLLTCFADLGKVAVYSVYNMISSNIKNVVISFASGMEAMFGDMLAKNEQEELQISFSFYESLISIVATILFSTTVVLIVPFIKIYVNSVDDVNYIEPIFALILIGAEYLYCLRLPYHSVVIAAGHFKETSFAAYGEVLINLVASITLISYYGLVGVASGTFIATLFRYIYYVFYLSKNIFYRRKYFFVKRIFTNISIFSVNIMIGLQMISQSNVSNYFEWIIKAILVTLSSAVITLTVYMKVYSTDFESVVRRLKRRNVK